MIFAESLLKVLDNSGAQVVKCFKVYGKRGYGIPGDTIAVSVKRVKPRYRIKKGRKFRAIILVTCRNLTRKTGQYVNFPYNGVVLLKKRERFLPLAKRMHTSVAFELRKKGGYSKIISMSLGIV